MRAATGDWRAMRARIEEVIEAFKANPPPLPVDEIAEANQLLQWLCADNFTFLGVREYRFSSDDMATDDSSRARASASCATRRSRSCAVAPSWW